MEPKGTEPKGTEPKGTGISLGAMGLFGYGSMSQIEERKIWGQQGAYLTTPRSALCEFTPIYWPGIRRTDT